MLLNTCCYIKLNGLYIESFHKTFIYVNIILNMRVYEFYVIIYELLIM